MREDKFDVVKRACEIANAWTRNFQNEKPQPLPKFDWGELEKEMREDANKIKPVVIVPCPDLVDHDIDYEMVYPPPHQSFFSKHNRLSRQVRQRPYTFGRKRCHLIMVLKMS